LEVQQACLPDKRKKYLEQDQLGLLHQVKEKNGNVAKDVTTMMALKEAMATANMERITAMTSSS
jgi:hypothetical protein